MATLASRNDEHHRTAIVVDEDTSLVILHPNGDVIAHVNMFTKPENSDWFSIDVIDINYQDKSKAYTRRRAIKFVGPPNYEREYMEECGPTTCIEFRR